MSASCGIIYRPCNKVNRLKLYPDKLTAHLQQKTAPVYFLHGDEPLQIMELGDQLRAHARDQGFDERQVFYANEDTDWTGFREAADSMSLFAERRLIEVRFPNGLSLIHISEPTRPY